MKRNWRRMIPGGKYGYQRDLILTATAKLEKGGNPNNYFSITGEIHDRKEYISGGQIVDEIYEYVPELRSYMKWHLVSTLEPLHYITNARYWAMFTVPWVPTKTPLEKRIEHLRSTIIYGALESDLEVAPEELGDDELVKWLEERRDPLMDLFMADMSVLFGFEL